MPLSNDKLLNVALGVVILLIDIILVIALVFPNLGKRIFHHTPLADIVKPADRIAERISKLCLVGISFFFGVQLLFDPLSLVICTDRANPVFIRFALSVAIAILIIINLFIQRKLQSENKTVKQDPRRSILSSFVAFGIGLLMIGAFLIFLNNRTGRPFETLDRIEMVSSSEGWSIGSSYLTGIMYHYIDGTWQRETIPDIGILTGISMISPQEGWVVSNNDSMLYYDNGTWVLKPSPVGELRSVDMISADEGWAVGNFGTILQFSRGQWIEVQSLVTEPLESISMLSETDGWIVGGNRNDGTTPSIILRYQRGKWIPYTSPTPLPLLAVQTLSATEAWAVGGTSYPEAKSIILHFYDGAWRIVDNPSYIPLSAIEMTSTNDGWAVGGGFFRAPFQCKTPHQTVQVSTLLRYQDGAWTRYADYPDIALQDIAMRSSGDGWITGWNAFWRYTGNNWAQVQSVP